LNEFQAKLGRNNGGTEAAAAAAPATYNHVPPEMVESLQLSSCRKLRQVRSKQQVCVYIYIHSPIFFVVVYVYTPPFYLSLTQ
jgi:hypothetical protein